MALSAGIFYGSSLNHSTNRPDPRVVFSETGYFVCSVHELQAPHEMGTEGDYCGEVSGRLGAII
jgi:hypothetical protein